MDLVRNEVKAALSRHGNSKETAEQILGRLSLEAWESEFPVIDLCLRECIRLHVAGSAFRRNRSGKDVPIGDTGEVVPKDAYAVSGYIMHYYHVGRFNCMGSFISSTRFISIQKSTPIQTHGIPVATAWILPTEESR